MKHENIPNEENSQKKLTRRNFIKGVVGAAAGAAGLYNLSKDWGIFERQNDLLHEKLKELIRDRFLVFKDGFLQKLEAIKEYANKYNKISSNDDYFVEADKELMARFGLTKREISKISRKDEELYSIDNMVSIIRERINIVFDLDNDKIIQHALEYLDEDPELWARIIIREIKQRTVLIKEVIIPQMKSLTHGPGPEEFRKRMYIDLDYMLSSLANSVSAIENEFISYKDKIFDFDSVNFLKLRHHYDNWREYVRENYGINLPNITDREIAENPAMVFKYIEEQRKIISESNYNNIPTDKIRIETFQEFLKRMSSE